MIGATGAPMSSSSPTAGSSVCSSSLRYRHGRLGGHSWQVDSIFLFLLQERLFFCFALERAVAAIFFFFVELCFS
ncbi:hypothetical protein RHGRI_001850 [Rhododendron griersonianum]|uniref:Uncharacterized protein n=1 Tax=Rhododendron griersonianum TaxID=479676 RepID=A0AAV6LNX4_9ERIC|nr:hypothetical protein RHGRI_001850 [Rhododendron griersonianum]